MTVIAMTREMGSRGKDVALGLAHRLGLEIIHHEIVEHDLAKRLNLPESSVHHFLEGEASLLERWRIDRSRLSLYTKEEILELACRGNVLIRGWGAAQLLHAFGNVLCVRICAPMRCREDVLLARVPSLKDRKQARVEIERNDAAHGMVIKRFFQTDWRDPEHYDLVLNTERLSIDACVHQVSQLATLSSFKQTEASRRDLTDKLIEFRVRGRLGSLGSSPGLRISVDNGTVSLGGAVHDGQIAHMIEHVVSQTDGVINVDNQMRITPLPRLNRHELMSDPFYQKHLF
jgi:cytidylate kinase